MEPQAPVGIAAFSQTTDGAEPGPAASPVEALAESTLLARAADVARAGRLDQAAGLVLPLVRTASPRVAALDLLARIYAQQRRWEEARQLWGQALRSNPLEESFQRAARRCDHALGRGPVVRSVGGLQPVLVLAACLAVILVVVTGQHRLQSKLESLTAQTAASPLTPAVAPASRPSAPADLAATVDKTLRADGVPDSVGLRVRMDGAVALLSGKVSNLSTRYHYEKVAREVQGVTAVDATGLTLATTYEVRPDDSLRAISLKLFGSSYYWRTLARANSLPRPYRLRAGQILVVPARDTEIGP